MVVCVGVWVWFCVSGRGLLRRFVLPTPSSIRIPSIPGCLKTLFSNIYLITDVDIKLKLILSALDQELCLTLSYPGPVFVKTKLVDFVASGTRVQLWTKREREGDCNRGTVHKRVSSPGQTELWCISTPSNASLHTAQHFFTSFYFLIFGGAFSSVQLTHQGYFFWGKPWLYFTFPDQIVWTWMTCASHSKREPCKKPVPLPRP